MSPNLTAFSKWPIASRLNVVKGGGLNGRNLVYLAEIAALTRLAIGAVRTYRNLPSKNDSVEISQNEKRKAFWERFFIEIPGSLSSIFILHAGQDLFSKYYENRVLKKAIHSIKEKFGDHTSKEAIAKGLSYDDANAFNRGIDYVFGTETYGVVDRFLNGVDIKRGGKTVRIEANLESFAKQAGDDVLRKVERDLRPLFNLANWCTNKSVIGAAMLTAIFGGVLLQLFNDRVYSPFLNQLFKEKKDVKTVPLNPAPELIPINRLQQPQHIPQTQFLPSPQLKTSATQPTLFRGFQNHLKQTQSNPNKTPVVNSSSQEVHDD